MVWRRAEGPLGVARFAGNAQRLTIDVGAHERDAPVTRHFGFAEKDRQRVDLFAGRAARGPDAQAMLAPTALQYRRQDRVSHSGDLRRVPQEIRFADCQVFDQLVQPARIGVVLEGLQQLRGC